MAAAAQPTYMTGFMIFCAEVRDEIVREIGESDPTEGGRRMFKMWKALPEAKRQEYDERARREQIPFEPAKRPQRSSSSGDGAKKPRKRQRKDPSAPKRALTAYMCFNKSKWEEFKAGNPDMASKDIMKLMGETWKGLSDEAKAPYAQMAAEDKERYAREMAAYKPAAAPTEA